MRGRKRKGKRKETCVKRREGEEEGRGRDRKGREIGREGKSR